MQFANSAHNFCASTSGWGAAASCHGIRMARRGIATAAPSVSSQDSEECLAPRPLVACSASAYAPGRRASLHVNEGKIMTVTYQTASVDGLYMRRRMPPERRPIHNRSKTMSKVILITGANAISRPRNCGCWQDPRRARKHGQTAATPGRLVSHLSRQGNRVPVVPKKRDRRLSAVVGEQGYVQFPVPAAADAKRMHGRRRGGGSMMHDARTQALAEFDPQMFEWHRKASRQEFQNGQVDGIQIWQFRGG